MAHFYAKRQGRHVDMVGMTADIHSSPSLDEGSLAHSRRVAAYCDALCKSFRIPAPDRTALIRAALTHHLHFEPSAMQPLLADCAIDARDARQSTSYLALDYHADVSSPPLKETLKHILEMADLFDEELESAPYGDRPLADILDEEAAIPGPVSFVLPHLRQFSRSRLMALTKHLPVFPAVAAEVLRARDCDLSLDRLVLLASSDQTLAGQLIQASNTAAFSPLVPITDIRRAITHLGTERSARLLTAAAIKPLLSIHGLHDLWHHSLCAATRCHAIALNSHVCPPGDAYLLGLIHDVGRLLLRIAPRNVTASIRTLTDHGCPSELAELLICGASHSHAGGDVLRHWGFSPEWASAVDCHHEPEHCDSPLAALLYITEYMTESMEDLPSMARLNAALRKLGWEIADLQALERLCAAVVVDTGTQHSRS